MKFSKIIVTITNAIYSLKEQFSDDDIVLQVERAEKAEDFFADPDVNSNAVKYDSNAVSTGTSEVEQQDWGEHFSNGGGGPG